MIKKTSTLPLQLESATEPGKAAHQTIPFPIIVAGERSLNAARLLSMGREALPRTGATLGAMESSTDPAIVLFLLDFRWGEIELAVRREAQRGAETRDKLDDDATVKSKIKTIPKIDKPSRELATELTAYLDKYMICDARERFRDVLVPNCTLSEQDERTCRVLSVAGWESRIGLYRYVKPKLTDLEQINRILISPDQEDDRFVSVKNTVKNALALLGDNPDTELNLGIKAKVLKLPSLDYYLASPEFKERRQKLKEYQLSAPADLGVETQVNEAELERFRLPVFKELSSEIIEKIGRDRRSFSTLKELFCQGEREHVSPHQVTIHFTAEIALRCPELLPTWINKLAQIEKLEPGIYSDSEDPEKITAEALQVSLLHQSKPRIQSEHFRCQPPFFELVFNFDSQASSAAPIPEINTESSVPANNDQVQAKVLNSGEVLAALTSVSAKKGVFFSFKEPTQALLKDAAPGASAVALAASFLGPLQQIISKEQSLKSEVAKGALTSSLSAIIRSYGANEDIVDRPKLILSLYKLDQATASTGLAIGYLALDVNARKRLLTNLNQAKGGQWATKDELKKFKVFLEVLLNPDDNKVNEPLQKKAVDIYGSVIAECLDLSSKTEPLPAYFSKAALEAAARLILIPEQLSDKDLVATSNAIEHFFNPDEPSLLGIRLNNVGRNSACAFVTKCRATNADVKREISALLEVVGLG